MYEPTLTLQNKTNWLVTNGRYHNGKTYGAYRRWMILHTKQDNSHSMTQNIPVKAGPGKNAWLWKNKQTKNGWEQAILFTKWAWVISEYALHNTYLVQDSTKSKAIKA